MKPGLVSVTFRKLPAQEIVDLCVRSGLKTIEWGGDVHVPPGDVLCASRIGDLTRSAGLSISAYGSYYRLASGEDFERVLACAEALGAPAIRVWAGQQGSAATGLNTRRAVIEDALLCADLAGSKGISICYEFHDGTLMDTTESAIALLAETEHPFIQSLWQPPHGQSLENCLKSLRAIMHRLHHVHVFHWWPDPGTRHPLADGQERWNAYVAELCVSSKRPDLLLEFVCNDDPSLLAGDAQTLLGILANPSPELGSP
jgi:sugar phosphate isomerase/epimerase